jgi:hypothetical protein
MKYVKLNVLADNKEDHDIICDSFITTILEDERHIVGDDGTYYIELQGDDLVFEVFALGRSFESAVRATGMEMPFTFDIVEIAERPETIVEDDEYDKSE